MKKVFLVGLLGVSLICGCGKPKTDEINVSVYKVDIPSAWTLNNTDDTSSWDYYIEKSDTHMAEVKIVITDISGDNIYDYDDFEATIGEAMEEYAGNFDSCDFGNAKKRTIDDVDALEYDISGTQTNVDFTGEMVVLPVSNYSKMVTMNFTQTEGCEKDHTKEFDTMVDSVKTK